MLNLSHKVWSFLCLSLDTLYTTYAFSILYFKLYVFVVRVRVKVIVF